MAALSTRVLGLTLILVSVWCEDLDGDVLSGGWLPATVDDSMKYYSNLCNVPKIRSTDMTKEVFEKDFKTKPFILTFANGAKDWVETEHWTLESLTTVYHDWVLGAGKSLDIVYNGGKGDTNRTFSEFVEEMRNREVPADDFTYLFDRNFYFNSSLPETINVPDFLFKEGDPILFIGSSGTGASWHKHMPAWNGVVFGQKRWFIYPIHRAPPGGLYSFTPTAWLDYIYPKLQSADKPLECVQNAGEIVYVPESYYHSVLNIGETIAISIQTKEVTTKTEAEFYSAMDAHYLATTTEDEDTMAVEYDRADKVYTDLHFLYPYNTDIMAHLSEIACERGDSVRCERILDHILAIDPWAINSLKLRSRIFYDRKNFSLSERDITTALSMHPKSKTLLRERANFLWNVRKSESKRAYQKVLSVLDPNTKEAEEIQDLLKITDFGPEMEQRLGTDSTMRDVDLKDEL